MFFVGQQDGFVGQQDGSVGKGACCANLLTRVES